MGREFELKFSADAGAFARLRADFGQMESIAMETTYFDTPDRVFSAGKMTLRLRRENGIAVCTLKTPGDGHVRGEWDTECEDISLAVPMLCKLAKIAPPDISTLVPICGARFTRLAKTVALADATAEIALDAGVLLGGGREAPLMEVEVELKSGSEATVVAYAQALAEQYGLQPQPQSKFRRASALAAAVRNPL